MRTASHLRDENEAEREGGAEEDERRHHDVPDDLLLVAEHVTDGHAEHADDHHVVDGHSDVLGVVERRNADVAGLPDEEHAEDEQQALVDIERAVPVVDLRTGADEVLLRVDRLVVAGRLQKAAHECIVRFVSTRNTDDCMMTEKDHWGARL